MSSISETDEISTFDWAVAYSELGWSVIPIIRRTKKPALDSWIPYRTKAPTPEELDELFLQHGIGIAVCLGPVSGNLVCRDFDVQEAYQRWAAEYPDHAAMLPTAETSRGMHVYCETVPEAVESLSRTGSSIINFADGELRGGGLAILPPSIHETGHAYFWTQHPFEGFPVIEDLERAGLAQSWVTGEDFSRESCVSMGFTYEDRGVQKTTEDHKGTTDDYQSHSPDVTPAPGDYEVVDLKPFADQIKEAVRETQPTGYRQRNRCIFELARKLKGIKELADVDPRNFIEVVFYWHEIAMPVIRTQSVEETFADFLRGWPKVKFPAGGVTLRSLFEEAIAGPQPKCSERFPTIGMRKLVALCERLHWWWHPAPFPLACRPAGKVLGVSHVTASQWLFILVQLGILQEVSKGGPKNRRASRYRYLGD